MRTAALIGAAAILAAAAAGTVVAARRGAPPARTLGGAAVRTARVTTQRYAIDVRVARNGWPTVLHIHGASAPGAISMEVELGATGPDGAAVLDGPFLYERAPSYIVVHGPVRWVRLHIAQLDAGSPALRTLHDMTPAPLLRVLGEVRGAGPVHGAGVLHGTVAYADPVVAASLHGLTGGLHLRTLRVTARIGADGLVHRIGIAGRAASGTATFRLDATLFDLGRPVRVRPPARGTFLDHELLRLAA